MGMILGLLARRENHTFVPLGNGYYFLITRGLYLSGGLRGEGASVFLVVPCLLKPLKDQNPFKKGVMLM